YAAQGWSYIKLSKFNDAQNTLKKGENFSKTKGLSVQDVVLAQANLACERRLLGQALALFGDFIKNYPQSPHWAQGYLGRANVFYLLKRYDDAYKDYFYLVGQKDQDTFAKCRFGLGWSELKLGHLPGEIHWFQDVFEHS